MSDKKSFVLMRDLLSTVELMTCEEKGNLFQAIIDHVDEKQIELPRELQFAFIPIKNQLDRDKEKWEAKREVLRKNASKGGKASASKRKQREANATKSNQTERVTVNVNATATVNATDTVTANDKDNYKSVKDLNIVAFEKYLAYRKESGVKKLTKHGEMLAAKKLVKFGCSNQMEVVEQSISNGWQGLFELKKEQSPKKENYADKIRERISNKSKPVIDGECHVVD